MKKKISRPTVDWIKAFNKLTYSATAWIINKTVNTGDPMIKGVGPADLAQGALLTVLEKYHELAKTGSEEEIIKLAYRIMWRDFLDLVRSADYKTRENLDDVTNGPNEPSVEAKQAKAEEDRSSAKKYYAVAKEDAELTQYIEAVLELPGYKREDVAEFLGVTVQEVTNRQRRLRYQYLASEKNRERPRKAKNQVND